MKNARISIAYIVHCINHTVTNNCQPTSYYKTANKEYILGQEYDLFNSEHDIIKHQTVKNHKMTG